MTREVKKKQLPEPKAEDDISELNRTLATLTALSPTEKAANLIGQAFDHSVGNMKTGETYTCCRTELARELGGKMLSVVLRGNMALLEEMLVAQAHSLDSLFCRLASQALRQENARSFEALMALALRSQNACRATIETLSTMKNPKAIALVGQANIAGIQQVNNAPQPLARAVESEDPQNKLMEVPGETNFLDSRTPAANEEEDPLLESVEALNRAENTGGKGPGRPKRIQRCRAREPAPSRP